MRKQHCQPRAAARYLAELLEPRTLLSTFAITGDFGETQATLDVSNRIKTWNPDAIISIGDDYYETDPSLDSTVGRYYHDYVSPYSGAYGAGSPSGNRFWSAL